MADDICLAFINYCYHHLQYLRIIGDLGQTLDSAVTVGHILEDKSLLMILHAGDFMQLFTMVSARGHTIVLLYPPWFLIHNRYSRYADA